MTSATAKIPRTFSPLASKYNASVIHLNSESPVTFGIFSKTDRDGTVLKIKGHVSLSKIDNFTFLRKIFTSTGEIKATLEIVLEGFNISEKVVQVPVNGSEPLTLSYANP